MPQLKKCYAFGCEAKATRLVFFVDDKASTNPDIRALAKVWYCETHANQQVANHKGEIIKTEKERQVKEDNAISGLGALFG